MISPASGIHRPSYNGAPAILTCTTINVWLEFPAIRVDLAPQRARPGAASLDDAFMKTFMLHIPSPLGEG